MRGTIFCVLAFGCGTQSTTAFVLESGDCALVNNLTVDGGATGWNGCRVYFSGAPYNVLTVQFTTPGTMGSFVTPAPTWARASVHAPGEIDTRLAAMLYTAGSLPTSLDATTMRLDLTLPFCGNLGAAGSYPVTADVGESSASFSLSLTGTCPRSGGQTSYTGGFIITASGTSAVADPNIVVTIP